jgi:signal transduction histidine kinase
MEQPKPASWERSLGWLLVRRNIDGFVVAAMFVLAGVDVFSTGGAFSVGGHRPLALAAAALLCSLLWWRRTRPLAVSALGLTVLVVTLRLGVVPQEWLFVYVIVVAYSAGAHARGWESVVTWSVTVVDGWVIAAFAADGSSPADYVSTVPLVAAPWLAAYAIRRQHAQADVDKRTALAQERARIARELHDVVAHGLSVITIQADAAEQAYRHDPDLVAEPLRAIRWTAQESLTEMRRLVGVLRVDHATVPVHPQPSLAELNALVDQSREAGTAVTLQQHGDFAGLPAGSASRHTASCRRH